MYSYKNTGRSLDGERVKAVMNDIPKALNQYQYNFFSTFYIASPNSFTTSNKQLHTTVIFR